MIGLFFNLLDCLQSVFFSESGWDWGETFQTRGDWDET